MRPRRILAGISLLFASVWMAPLVSDVIGTSVLFGFITVCSILAFIAGCISWSGVVAK